MMRHDSVLLKSLTCVVLILFAGSPLPNPGVLEAQDLEQLKANWLHLSKVAQEGVGGDPHQPWRTVKVKGPIPGNKIELRTNFLPPYPRDDAAARNTFNTFVRMVPEELTRRLLDQINVLPMKDLQMDDILVRTWYGIPSLFVAIQSIIEPHFGLKVPDVDLYGDLQIFIHNSDATYNEEVGTNKDRAGRGVYLRHENEIHVKVDERTLTREDAKNILTGLGSELGDQQENSESPPSFPATDNPALEEAIERARRSPGLAAMQSGQKPIPGLKDAFDHEVAHWVFNLATSSLPGEGLGVPQCLHEGAVLFVIETLDQFAITQLSRLGAQEMVEDLANRDWFQIWLDSSEDVGKNPRDLLLLDDAEFDAEVARSPVRVYADCRFVAAAIGPDLFQESKKRGVPPIEVVKQDFLGLQVPWQDIRSYMKSQKQ